jgi:predicted ATP-dependent serine protease
MNSCSSCGHERNQTDIRCPECGVFYPTIAELLAEEEAYEAAHSLRGQWQKICDAPDRKHALFTAVQQFWHELSLKGKFSLFVIFAFVFALIVTVL